METEELESEDDEMNEIVRIVFVCVLIRFKFNIPTLIVYRR